MLKQIKDVLDTGKRFLITTHIDPDGDSIGSLCSLYLALEQLNKDVHAYMKDEVPYKYRFLPKPDYILDTFPDDKYDAIFVLDCGELHRVGDGYECLKRDCFVVNIDHHSTNSVFGSLNFIDEGASSTAALLYRLFGYLGIDITYDMAVNIYTAILTDTGSFRYENTDPEALDICEHMIRLGVKPTYIAKKVYESHPKERFLLLGRVLNTLETYKNDKIAIAYITDDMFRKTNATEEHSDGFVEFIKEIENIEVAVLIRQINESRYKISMRSKGDTDVARICNLFGGGGHIKAAGCYINGDLDTVKNKILEVI